MVYLRIILALERAYELCHAAPSIAHLTRTLFLDCALFVQAIEFARQLSVYMVEHNRTKLKRQESSTLFAPKTTIDVFFDSGPLAKAARDAAPIKESGGFLSFIHKTVMEYSAAMAVASGITVAVDASGLSPQQIIQYGHRDAAAAVHSGEGQTPSGGGRLERTSGSTSVTTLPEEAQGVAAEDTGANASSQDSSGNVPAITGKTMTPSEKRQILANMQAFVMEIANSPLCNLELEMEPAIRDFLIDLILKGTGLGTSRLSLHAVLMVTELVQIKGVEPGLGDHRGKKIDFTVARDNIKALFGSKLTRRMNGTLLHEAAKDGAEKLVKLTIDVMGKLVGADRAWLDAQDDEGKTGEWLFRTCTSKLARRERACMEHERQDKCT